MLCCVCLFVLSVCLFCFGWLVRCWFVFLCFFIFVFVYLRVCIFACLYICVCVCFVCLYHVCMFVRLAPYNVGSTGDISGRVQFVTAGPSRVSRDAVARSSATRGGTLGSIERFLRLAGSWSIRKPHATRLYTRELFIPLTGPFSRPPTELPSIALRLVAFRKRNV